MKRIRYKKVQDYALMSDQLVAGVELIRVHLNLFDLTFNITNSKNILIKTGKAVSVQMLKKTAKSEAKKLGVTFEDEVRPRVLSQNLTVTSQNNLAK